MSRGTTLISDQNLLHRVISNLLKNALEASDPGECVTLGCTFDDREARFRVHNPQAMPREVQLQVFQRSFSTKGAGRGLGTYSIRLLTKRYGSAFLQSLPDCVRRQGPLGRLPAIAVDWLARQAT